MESLVSPLLPKSEEYFDWSKQQAQIHHMQGCVYKQGGLCICHLYMNLLFAYNSFGSAPLSSAPEDAPGKDFGVSPRA